MNKYEIMAIVNAQLPQEEKEAATKHIADVIVKNGGKVMNNQLWLDKHRFVFTIKKCSEGTYYLIKFECPSPAIEKIKQAIRIHEETLRFVITRLE